MSTSLKVELTGFFKGHWPMLLLLVPMVLLSTVLHEAAHGVAVVVQGGRITQFVWLPTWEEWGYIRYKFPPGVEYSSFAILVAPYCMWLVFCLAAGLICLRRRPWPFWFAATVFLWMFVGPLADIANIALPYLLGAYNDFSGAFGPPGLLAHALIGLGGVASAVAGFAVQKRLYRERALSGPAYIIMFFSVAMLVMAVSTARLF